MSLRIKAARNRGLACRHAGCNIGRASISPYCDAHSKRVERYGHPDGRALHRRRDYGVELELVEAFINRQADHEGVVSALKWLDKWLTQASHGEAVPGRQEMQRLQANAVPPLAILKESAALFLLSQWSPRKLPDDVRLDFAIGIAVLRLAPLGKRYGQLHGRPKLYSKRPGKVARREVGRRIRLTLAPLLMNISEAIKAEDVAKKQFDAALRIPFKSKQA